MKLERKLSVVALEVKHFVLDDSFGEPLPIPPLKGEAYPHPLPEGRGEVLDFPFGRRPLVPFRGGFRSGWGALEEALPL